MRADLVTMERCLEIMTYDHFLGKLRKESLRNVRGTLKYLPLYHRVKKKKQYISSEEIQRADL